MGSTQPEFNSFFCFSVGASVICSLSYGEKGQVNLISKLLSVFF